MSPRSCVLTSPEEGAEGAGAPLGQAEGAGAAQPGGEAEGRPVRGDKWLRGGVGRMEPGSAAVPSDRTRGSGHRQKPRRFWLDMRGTSVL